MKKSLICIAMLCCCSGCTNIPYIGGLFHTDAVEHVEEEAIEETVESAAEMVGRDVHVEIDIDPATDPHCMHCSFHCPEEIKE